MIQSLGQIMLYVNNLDENAKFWKEQAGFEKVEKVNTEDGDYIYIVAPKLNSEVELVLQNRFKVEKMSPELNFGTPSILMQTSNLEEVYNHFIKNKVNANPIVEFGDMKVFNFSDNENNYFAIREVK